MRMVNVDKLQADLLYKLQHDPLSADGKKNLKWMRSRLDELAEFVPDVVYCRDCSRHENDCPVMSVDADSVLPDTFWCAYGDRRPTPAVERCVCCGVVIPEGRQVCPICEKGYGDP